MVILWYKIWHILPNHICGASWKYVLATTLQKQNNKNNNKNYCSRMCEACSWDQVTLATRFEARFVYWVPNSMAKNARSREGNRVKRLPCGNRLNPVLLHLNKTAERGYVDFSGCTANVWDCLDMSKTQEPLVRTENPSRAVRTDVIDLVLVLFIIRSVWPCTQESI